MELQLVNRPLNNTIMRVQQLERVNEVTPAFAVETAAEVVPENKRKAFIEANTIPVSLAHLKNECIIPTYRDNEKTISHYEMVDTLNFCVNHHFKGSTTLEPQIRVSHQINGRISQALHKKVSELEEWEKTRYYERMMFLIEVPSITQVVNGNTLNLSIAGVRALNHESLFSKKTIEKFKIVIGFQNLVCCNLLISTDGAALEIRVSSLEELIKKVFELFSSYDMPRHLRQMESFGNYALSENQFAQILGKARLYPFLKNEVKKEIPQLTFNDCQLNTVARDYYTDKSFCRAANGEIDLWKLYQLLTGSNKSSYIDSFLDRSLNAFTFTESLVDALDDRSKSHWFLS